MDPRTFPADLAQRRVLDLGCGIGFWLIELGTRGCGSLVGADLSQNSLRLASRRCELYGVSARLVKANAENLDFESGSFDHVNCQGVIHHTPDSKATIRAMHRVL